jgi:hypothetical protein
MTRYQVEVTETFYYYILVDTENEKEAKKLAIRKIDPLGMEYSNDFSEEGSHIALESVLPLEEEELRQPEIEVGMARFAAVGWGLNRLASN